MSYWLYLTNALRTIYRHRLRSFLTILGIMIGVAAVVTVIGVGAGSQHQVLQRVESLGANLLFIEPGVMETGGVQLEKKFPTLTVQDIEAVRQFVPNVLTAAPSVYADARVIYGAQNWISRIQGTTRDYFPIRGWEIAQGRMFTEREEVRAKKVAILGETVSRELFGMGHAIGKTIRIGKTPFKVVGVLKRKGQAPGGADQDDKVLIPLDTARLRIIGLSKTRPGAIHYAHIRLDDPGQINQTIEDIQIVLRRQHHIPMTHPDDFVINDLTAIQESMAEATKSLTFWLASVAAISLVVGGISIMNVMLVAVRERTEEIGLRRAVGATNKDIRNQFLIEATCLTTIGGLSGLALGLGLVVLIARLRDFPVMITPGALILALGSAAAVGIVSGLYPALLASRLDPIRALKRE
ncbi:ABC transporter permease [Photobacterium sp. OFAV2-7]|uniref:ABC transporter permease n=1 Tax=Photobacterium sp. OFAV2-7 TaxID=2917748 RepID=UPI001EF75021|nr:ABC transporter permease [Photobacterium sp. OFAV2-7]MCG7587840.1 ABC transporter permease [Photobacterium sp. OFAV2-7]